MKASWARGLRSISERRLTKPGTLLRTMNAIEGIREENERSNIAIILSILGVHHLLSISCWELASGLEEQERRTQWSSIVISEAHSSSVPVLSFLLFLILVDLLYWLYNL